MQDTFRHKGLRKKLIEELREKGVDNEAVLRVMGEIPRHLFMDTIFDAYAYKDTAFQIGYDQTISQPYTVAVQTILLEVKKNDKILEIGTGSGYQARVLELLEARVFSVERYKNLYTKTKQFLSETVYSSVKTFYGDGYLGLPSHAPFDKIIITCGAPTIPDELLKQLKVGGIMVIPHGDSSQIMKKVIKISEEELDISEHGDFSFVPMLSKKV